MREVKFRAWEIEDKDMQPVTSLEYRDEGELIKIGLGDYLRYPSSIVLMQFTGLLDKNGVKIYEGDIIVNLATHSNGREYRHMEKCRVVEYSVSGKSAGFNIGKGRIEVIGNIHQNPDLIKGTK